MSNSSKPTTTSPQARARSVTNLLTGLGASLRRSSRAVSAPTPPSPTLQPTSVDRLQLAAQQAAEISIPGSVSPRPAGQRGPMVEFYQRRSGTQYYSMSSPPSPQPQLALPPPHQQLQLTSTSLVAPTTSPQSFGQAAAEAVGETAITAITAASLGTAGSAAGSLLAGSYAESQLGVFARPAAESIGSYLGGTAGAVMGATAIRCPSRRRSLPATGPAPYPSPAVALA